MSVRGLAAPRRGDYGSSTSRSWKHSSALDESVLTRQPSLAIRRTRPSSTWSTNSEKAARIPNACGGRHDVRVPPTLTKTFRHTPVGVITLDCDALTLADRDQHLVLYSAARNTPMPKHSLNSLW